MKSKAKSIIRTMLLSATVALFHNVSKTSAKRVENADGFNFDKDESSLEVSHGKRMIVKDVYKIMRDGSVKLIAGHRSHSSHRSHRSSGGHYSATTTKKNNNTATNNTSVYTTTKTSSTSSAAQPVDRLGERVLDLDMYGADVDELVRLLIDKGYAPNPDKLKKKETHYVFTEDIRMAIKVFQAFHQISPTGNLNAVTVSKLKE